ncbi:hypothetical protein FT663_03792 [Candidozyma haemuli var. vulneris]|uniref:Ribosome assembly factor mrt4 n=1 Tax=Candidozyma haemuli TaxID=45357 RepID=A0A2V1AZR0_9ASCO|nr:hypothetical protein CXQ85_003076 [[Candida] haemuloni]KAF3986529.1 hypothetical protein FT662_04521 [[Candida] haemuloni var. vulneris]KAF3989049.1 hypothetical protein FT663_03792 [[Candida] haemuloni var. vulneris]PVH23342.1 hypothetical protein CXQ85_003076 [[Candida] haemuloni]
MPRSKRSKLVTLSKTDKKGKENKERIFDAVRTALDEFRFVVALQLGDLRNNFLQDIRGDWAGSKIISGKRKVLQKALGETDQEAYKDNSNKLSKVLSGEHGLIALLFTDELPETVDAYFSAFRKTDYAKANNDAPIDFIVPQGVVYSRGGQVPLEEDVPMSHSLEVTLRTKYKMPTKIKAGKIFLDEPFEVCRRGDHLDVTKALILKQFGVAATEFTVKILGSLDSETGQCKKY